MDDSPTGFHAAAEPSTWMGAGHVNPGSGPVPRAKLAHAKENIEHFARELPGDVLWERAGKGEDGRWPFTLHANGRQVEVEMPGLPLDSVRYLGREHGHNAWHYPRLYVDGSSWLWKYAIEMAEEALFEDSQPTEKGAA